METPWKPTKEQLLAAANKSVPDVIAPDLRVLFVGINPGLYTAAIGHHFGRPGNRFWPTLYAAGFTARLLSPFEEEQLLKNGYGITNMVSRATATAAELSAEELRAGGRALVDRVREFRPHLAAVLGVESYRKAFDRPNAQLGRQEERLGEAILWILPNPSGLNAHYQLPELAQLFREMRIASER